MNANEKQIGGRHYKDRKIQHWDYAAQLPYLEGLATKYIDRHARKGGKEDLLKAIHTIEKMIEVYYPRVEEYHRKELPPNPEGAELMALLAQRSAQLDDPPIDQELVELVEQMKEEDEGLCANSSTGHHSYSHVYRHGEFGKLVEVMKCDLCGRQHDRA